MGDFLWGDLHFPEENELNFTLNYCTTTTTFGSFPISWRQTSQAFRSTWVQNDSASLNRLISRSVSWIIISSDFSSTGSDSTSGSPTELYFIVNPEDFFAIPMTSTHWVDIWNRSWSSFSAVCPTIRPSTVTSLCEAYSSVSRTASFENSSIFPFLRSMTLSFAYQSS